MKHDGCITELDAGESIISRIPSAYIEFDQSAGSIEILSARGWVKHSFGMVRVSCGAFGFRNASCHVKITWESSQKPVEKGAYRVLNGRKIQLVYDRSTKDDCDQCVFNRDRCPCHTDGGFPRLICASPGNFWEYVP